MSRLDWTPVARKDVDDIYDYIGRRDRRPATADQVVSKIVAACESIADTFAAHSAIGTARPELGESYRIMTYQRWVIVFRPVPNGIEILRVLDGSRDFPKLFEL